MVYPLSLYSKSEYCVVWSPEEHAARTAEGWSAEDVREAAQAEPATEPESEPEAEPAKAKRRRKDSE